MDDGYKELLKELAGLLNKYSMENGSNTPDFILAEYLMDCLGVLNTVISKRDSWYKEEKVNYHVIYRRALKVAARQTFEEKPEKWLGERTENEFIDSIVEGWIEKAKD